MPKSSHPRSLLKKSEEDLLDYQNRSQNQKKKNGHHTPADVSSYLSQESAMLSNLRARRAQLLVTETESHPDVVAVNGEIEELEKKIGTLHTMESPASDIPCSRSFFRFGCGRCRCEWFFSFRPLAGG